MSAANSLGEVTGSLPGQIANDEERFNLETTVEPVLTKNRDGNQSVSDLHPLSVSLAHSRLSAQNRQIS